MINKNRKLIIEQFYDKSNTFNEYSSIISPENSTNYYLNMINPEQNQFNYGIDDNLNNKINSNHKHKKTYNFSPLSNNFPSKTLKNYYKDIYKTNSNSIANSFKELTLLDNSLSNLSINKYRLMKSNQKFDNYYSENKDSNDYQTIPNDIDSYGNQLLTQYKTSTNTFNNKKNSSNEQYINENINDNNDSFNTETMKLKNNNNIKNRIRLNKEIINYNNLEKKINKKIKDSSNQKLLGTYKLDYYNYNDNIKYKNNYENKKINLINEYMLNKTKNNINSHKKLRKMIKDEKDIKLYEKKMRRNTTFNFNSQERKESLNNSFIKYLKKDNHKLVHINTIYKQLIDTFFYFINQLSKKYSFKKEIKDVTYYLSNPSNLSNILIDLEQHLSKFIRADIIFKNNEKYKNVNKENESFNKKKLFSMNLENTLKNKKIENPICITRNENIGKQYYSQLSKKDFSKRKIECKTMPNNSLNYLNKDNENEYFKLNNKINKGKKKSDRLIKLLHKINSGGNTFSKQKKLNNKIIIKKNNINNN